jgi:DNA polymerase-1
MATLVLIDASSNVYRAFFALPRLSNAQGLPTNAVLGFTTMLQKILREKAPDYVAVVWDPPSGGPDRRKQLYPDYKANRDATPEDLRSQLEPIREIVGAYGLAQIVHPGEEADDVIATLTARAKRAGLDVRIVSTDKDLMQLVDEGVHLLDTMRDREYDPAEVERRFGVPPERMLDLRALTGDSSDNIPGVKGIGDKGAAQLLAEHGSLDELLSQPERIASKRHRTALAAGADSARLSRELSRLRDDLPVELDLDALAVPAADTEKLAQLFSDFEFKRLLNDLDDHDATAATSTPSAHRTDVVSDAEALRSWIGRIAAAERIALACALDSDDPVSGELTALYISLEAGTAAALSVAALGEEPVLEALRESLGQRELIWAGHDLKRDWIALERRGVELRGELRDVAVAAYVVDPAQQVRRPEVLARAFLGAEIPAREDVLGKGKSRRRASELSEEECASLFGAEAACALELEPVLRSRLVETGQLELYEEVEVPLVRVLARLEVAGVRIDEDRLRRLSGEIEAEIGSLELRIYELAGERFNIGSPKQLQHILFEKLSLPPSKKTKTGFSTDESVLEELALSYDLPREIMSYRRLAKLKSTYVDALPPLVNPETGRIHASFNQTVAATGRLSVSNPNLQNIPIRTQRGQQIREAFIPAEGRLLLSSDYSQIELRILAHLSGDATLLDAFERGDDIHVRTASEVFGIDPSVVTDEQRSRMKGINFGIIYGSSAFGIARQLGIAQTEAREHIQAYFERYPGVRKFLDRAVAEARERGFAETLFGRRRYLPDLDSRNRVLRSAAERMAVNSVIQGSAADIIKRAMIRVDERLAQPGAPDARMILQVHDELLFEVVPTEAERLRALVEREMGAAAEIGVPLEVHSGSGSSWREAH